MLDFLKRNCIIFIMLCYVLVLIAHRIYFLPYIYPLADWAVNEITNKLTGA